MSHYIKDCELVSKIWNTYDIHFGDSTLHIIFSPTIFWLQPSYFKRLGSNIRFTTAVHKLWVCSPPGHDSILGGWQNWQPRSHYMHQELNNLPLAGAGKHIIAKEPWAAGGVSFSFDPNIKRFRNHWFRILWRQKSLRFPNWIEAWYIALCSLYWAVLLNHF